MALGVAWDADRGKVELRVGQCAIGQQFLAEQDEADVQKFGQIAGVADSFVARQPYVDACIDRHGSGRSIVVASC